MFGQVVVGELDGPSPTRNVGAQVGDVLVLTKPLGVGLLATAHKRLPSPAMEPGGEWAATYEAAIASMTELNNLAAAAAGRAGVNAATDITGFGLAGHLFKILKASGVSAIVDVDALPLLPGARDLIAAGFAPGGTVRNLEYVAGKLIGGSESDRLVVADPQTSGGLLMSCPPATLDELVDDLRRHDRLAAVIGTVTSGDAGTITLS